MAINWLILNMIITLALPASFAVEELILTPFIHRGDLIKAKEMATDNINLSKVKSALGRSTTSYSGYLTVDETYNSNVFFWLFPAVENPDNASVILVMSKVPGSSILEGIFLEEGPFYVDENLVLQERNITWAQKHTLIYIDCPVGAGFSFTDAEEGLIGTAAGESDEVYEAMKQLLQLFPEYLSNDVYIAGSNFAGRVIPKLVLAFEERGAKDDLKLNIKGVIIGGPWIAPQLQIKFSDVLLPLSLIDENQAQLFVKEEKELQRLIEAEKYTESIYQINKIYFAPTSLASTETGFTDQRSLLHANPPEEVDRYVKFVNSKEVHNYLHVGLHKYQVWNPEAFTKFFYDSGHNDVVDLEKILDKGINVLIYAPQFEFVAPLKGVDRVVFSLKWNGQDEFKKAGRKIWRVDNDVAGYVKSFNNFHYVMLRNAGYLAPMDQPKWCNDMVERFTSGTLF